jgi:anti-sigma factor RsiW
MNDPNKLREISWRRKLTAAEAEELRAWLAEHPEAQATQADLEVESALTESLGRMPDAPVSTNFTARVLQEVQREVERQVKRDGAVARRSGWSWHAFLPRAALATMAFGLGMIYYAQHRAERRTELAHSIVQVSTVAAVPGPAALENFDAVSGLSEGDPSLLALLQ